MNQHHRLQLTPDDQAAIEKERLERETRYRRKYWQQYKQTHERVYGTLTKSEFARVKTIADQNHRPVWTQIWAESCAYRKAEFLPNPEILGRQDRLIGELRRIGNNLNQLAKQGHWQTPGDDPQAAIEGQLAELEQHIIAFTRQPWIKP